MKDILSIYLNVLFFCLIPLFLTTNQIYSTCEDNSFLEQNPSFEEKLDDICKQKKQFCIMIDAIKYSFNYIKSYSMQHEENKTLKYESAKSSNISCQDISAIIENDEDESNKEEGKYIISLLNCTSVILGRLIVGKEKYNNYKSEIYFDKINIFLNKIHLNGEMHVLIESKGNKSFSYDEEYTFVDDNFREKMDIIMNLVYKNYTYHLKSIIELDEYDLLSQIQYFSDINNQFAKQYSFINQNINKNEKKITYVAYNEFKYDSLINVKNHIYIPNLTIFFEYALNFNITYNEGNFTLDYMNFSKTKNNDVYIGNIIKKSAEFDGIISPEDSKRIWNDIKNDLLKKFKLYKK